jgi:hypothetical protein
MFGTLATRGGYHSALPPRQPPSEHYSSEHSQTVLQLFGNNVRYSEILWKNSISKEWEWWDIDHPPFHPRLPLNIRQHRQKRTEKLFEKFGHRSHLSSAEAVQHCDGEMSDWSCVNSKQIGWNYSVADRNHKIQRKSANTNCVLNLPEKRDSAEFKGDKIEITENKHHWSNPLPPQNSGRQNIWGCVCVCRKLNSANFWVPHRQTRPIDFAGSRSQSLQIANAERNPILSVGLLANDQR